MHEAERARNSITKLIYEQLFEFIISKINNSINSKEHTFIDIYDIAGFGKYKFIILCFSFFIFIDKSIHNMAMAIILQNI